MRYDRLSIRVSFLLALGGPLTGHAQPAPDEDPTIDGASDEYDDPQEDHPERPTPRLSDIRKYDAEPGFPGSIRIPNTNISIQVGGFAQVDVIKDFNRIGSPDSFVVSSIPGTPGNNVTGFQASARQSRVFVETRAPLALAPLKTYLELDFFDPQNDQTLHLRQAFGELGHKKGIRLLAGQFWTTFMDATIWPGLLDYEGPAGILFSRTPQVRLTVPLGHDVELSVAVEQPGPQLTPTTNVTGLGKARFPDFTSNARWKHAYGHLQLGAVIRDLGLLPATGDVDESVGWGVAFTGTLAHFWNKDELIWQVAGGQGIARYFNDTTGLGLDGFVIGDDIDASGQLGIVAAYHHYWWGHRLSSYFCYSLLRLFDLDDAPSGTYKQGQYVAVDLQYKPHKRLLAGIEYLFGHRSNHDAEDAHDHRLQVSLQARF